jgi:hypothetical protein
MPVGVRHNAYKQFSKLSRCYHQHGRRLLRRCCDAVFFGVCLAITRSASHPLVVVAVSYCTTYALTRLKEGAHGRWCRVATAMTASALTTWLLSAHHGLLAAALLTVCPQCYLWWPQKNSSYPAKPISISKLKPRLALSGAMNGHTVAAVGVRRAEPSATKKRAHAENTVAPVVCPARPNLGLKPKLAPEPAKKKRSSAETAASKVKFTTTKKSAQNDERINFMNMDHEATLERVP